MTRFLSFGKLICSPPNTDTLDSSHVIIISQVERVGGTLSWDRQLITVRPLTDLKPCHLSFAKLKVTAYQDGQQLGIREAYVLNVILTYEN